MNTLSPLIKSFAADQRGATAIEYCLIGSLISILIVTGATQIGQTVLGMFTSAANGFK